MVTATTNSTTTNITASGDNHIDSLILGGKWGGVLGSAAIIDYSFPGVGSQWSTTYGGDYSPDNEPTGIAALEAGQQTAFRTILQSFSDVANITFNEVVEDNTVGGSVGDIRIAYSDVLIPTPALGWAYEPFNSPVAGDIWIESTFTDATEGSLDVHVLAHELGHALGLAHPFDAGSLNGDVLPWETDTTQYTIMSYTDSPDYGAYYPFSAQLYDIAALHYLYGANMTTRTEDTVYTTQSGTIPQSVYSIWDAGGKDTLSAVGETVGATINLTAGSFSSIGLNNVGGAAVNNISIAFGAVIENATGSNFSDTLTGNNTANRLIGNGGNDRLFGLSGNDTLDGGIGKDWLYGGASKDRLYGRSGNDTLDGGRHDDRLYGGGGNDRLYGRSGNDILVGGAGDDRLYGHGGTNKSYGGMGNDVYYIVSASDAIVEYAGEGTDLVQSYVSYRLTDNVENLALLGSTNLNGTGNALNNVITGNGVANRLRGDDGADRLVGLNGNDTLDGGAGRDKLYGGGSKDTLYGRSGNDTLDGGSSNDRLFGGGGNDRLYGRTGNDSLIAGAGNDVLYGNGGNDILDGGSGYDRLYGGAGVDIFQFSALADAGDTIYDFNIAGGEYLKVGTLLGSLGWGGGNAVADGWLSLVQNGANVDVMLDVNGGGDALTTKLAAINSETVGGLGANWWLA